MQLSHPARLAVGALVLVLVLGRGGAARADTSFESKVQVYADSDHTQVVSPSVQASADVTAKTNITLGYVADAVSSASVDVVSQASKITIHDTRQQVSAGIAHIFGSLTAHGGYSLSHENDYLSNSLSAGIAQDLFEKNSTLALGYALSLNQVGRAEDENFSRSLTVNSVNASWTQVVNRRLIGQLTYELTDASGYQASPYRFVPVRASLDAAPSEWIAETDPDSRWRHAIVVAANQAVGDDSAIQGDYRLYHDTWGITSHTIGARYFTHLTSKLELRLRQRFYTQDSATFYKNNYFTVERYMTYDRELSPLWSETVGVKLSYLFTPHVEGELKCDVFYYSYSDFAPLQSRTGTNSGLGVTLTY